MKSPKEKIQYITLVGKEYFYIANDETKKLIDAINKGYPELVMHKIFNKISEDTDDIDDVSEMVCEELMIKYETLIDEFEMHVEIYNKILNSKPKLLISGFSRYLYHLLDEYGIDLKIRWSTCDTDTDTDTE